MIATFLLPSIEADYAAYDYVKEINPTTSVGSYQVCYGEV